MSGAIGVPCKMLHEVRAAAACAKAFSVWARPGARVASEEGCMRPLRRWGAPRRRMAARRAAGGVCRLRGAP